MFLLPHMARISLPDAPSVVAGHGRAAIFTADGELLLLPAAAAAARLRSLPPPILVHAPATFRRIGIGGAQECYGVTPDLCTLVKISGDGCPRAAIAGREDIMSLFDRGRAGDEKFLTQIGTLSGNPVAAAAGLATLEVLRRPGAYDKVFATGRELMAGMTGMLEKAGLPAQVIGVPPLFDIVYAAGDVADYRATLRADPAMQRRFNRVFRESRILKGESKFYVSLAHEAADVKRTLEVVQAAVDAELAESRVAAQ